MKFLVCVAAVALLMAVAVDADCYMHNPRGSNNRLNEKSANRNNGDRLFDSQNNNRGGYNVGDRTNEAFNGNDSGDASGTAFTGFTNGLDKDQYAMMFYEESKLAVEWTAQHGCGGHEEGDTHKLNCNMVLQFACNTNNEVQTQPALQMELKDGRNTNTPDTAGNFAAAKIGSSRQTRGTRVDQNDSNGRGRHESEAWYYECERRERNMGLFTADQKLKGKTSKHTRQNPNGGRRGLECPEERDYYPNWNPSPWMDIAYMTSNMEDCSGEGGFDVAGNSQNNNQVYRCSYTGNDYDNNEAYSKAMKALTKEQCDELTAEDASIKWVGYSHGLAAPDCIAADWSRVNHLGNGANGQPNMYNWTLPKLSNTDKNGVGKNTMIMQYPNAANSLAKCVLRIRYNISTDDYDPRTTDAMYNDNKEDGNRSPVTQNPTVDVGAHLQGLRLAINTAQFGRTFQDRSHTFYIKKRPAGIGGEILNLNVRGKRGNIVQTFPSVEYDFVPSRFHAKTSSHIHVQWTGSNTHNNGNPAGDGQAGDAGEGTGGTDRQNMVGITTEAMNYPIPMDKPDNDAVNFIKQMTCKEGGGRDSLLNEGQVIPEADCAMRLATSNQYWTLAEANNADQNFNPLLNDAPASLVGGILLTPKKAGTYHYMNTRNNNFSNRSQKGTIVVD